MPGRDDTYDDHGDLQQSRVYSSGVVTLRRARSYDPSGNRLDRLYQLQDSNGTPPPPPAAAPPGAAPLSPDVRDADGALLFLTASRLDSSGRVVEEVRYAGATPAENAIRSRTTFRYDEKGHVLEEESFLTSGKRTSKSEYSRNAAGEVVETRLYGADDSAPLVIAYTYEARDANGNWTERTVTTTYPGGGRKQVAVQHESRTILYHEVGKGDVAVRTMPRFLNTPRPDYPATCAERGVHGTIVVKGLFAADGTVLWAEVTTGLPCGLNAKAIEAVYKLKFKPAENAAGKPVACWATVTIVFGS